MQAGESIGKYRLKTLLGEGGQGEVWLAEDTGLIHREVALKVIFADNAAVDPDELTLEAVVMARMYYHPNLPMYYDVLEVPSGVALVMEFLPGYNLGQLLDQRPHGLAWPELASVAEGLLMGLAHTHRYDVVHRDLKPANIQVFNPMGTMRPIRVKDVKVLDFGLALHPRGPMDDPSMLVGTFPYMSPEQITKGTQGPASDIHACGVILYELITGRHPIPFPTGAPIHAILDRMVKYVPEPPSAIRKDCPAVLARWIMKALAKSPNQRPASAEALAKGILPSLRRMAKGDHSATEQGCFVGDPIMTAHRSEEPTTQIAKGGKPFVTQPLPSGKTKDIHQAKEPTGN